MQYQYQIQKNRLAASVSLAAALLATTVMSAGVASLADSGLQQDATRIVVTATRMVPAAASGAHVLRAAVALPPSAARSPVGGGGLRQIE